MASSCRSRVTEAISAIAASKEESVTTKKKATPKVMKLIDPSSGQMECRVCGAYHWANTKDGNFQRGAWQCQHGCKLDNQ